VARAFPLLSRALAGRPPVTTGRYRLGYVQHITANSSRLRDELDWAPTVDFASAVRAI
jgi:dTDP-L-rhamnose 4-epimerase